MEFVQDYSEEIGIGEHLKPGVFDFTNRIYCLISNNNAICYDVQTGQRIKVLSHSSKVIGLHLLEDKLTSLTDDGHLTQFDLSNGSVFQRNSIRIPGHLALWTYEVNGDIYIVAVPITFATENQNKNFTSIFRLLFEQQRIVRNDDAIEVELLAKLDFRPTSRQHLAFSSTFGVVCQDKKLSIIRFNDKEDAGQSRRSTLMENFNGKTEFTLKAKFDVPDQNLVKFDGVFLAGHFLYASLNIGRLYVWSRLKESGLDNKNRSHVTLTSYDFVFAASFYRTTFLGTGSGQLIKYNIEVASGAGRWHQLEQLFLTSPIDGLMLSHDDSLLCVILADNSACVIQTGTMSVVSRTQALNNSDVPPFNWAGIVIDPAHPNSFVMNARIGHIQWIDPLKWQTVELADIARENVPARDTFNMPNVLWLNSYLIYLNAASLVTCDCRRNNLNNTYLKIFRRSASDSATDFIQEDCFVVNSKICFIQSTLDELRFPTAAEVEHQEFLFIDSNNYMNVYVRDEARQDHWRKDLLRINGSWQRSKVEYCSRIRQDKFATVNKLNDKTFVLMWDLEKLEVIDCLDLLNQVKQVEWWPPEYGSRADDIARMMLIVSGHGITAYDFRNRSCAWVVVQKDLTLFTNQFISFVHDSKRVIQFDPRTGLLAAQPKQFSREQAKIIATGDSAQNVCFIGISNEGRISLLKPNTGDNEMLDDLPLIRKKTPFAELLKQERPRPRSFGDTRSRISLQQHSSARKYLDGSAHTLAPITKIAPLFVRSCLIKRPFTTHQQLSS